MKDVEINKKKENNLLAKKMEPRKKVRLGRKKNAFHFGSDDKNKNKQLILQVFQMIRCHPPPSN